MASFAKDMKSCKQYIAKQFRLPEGVGGKLSTWFMNHLNKRQYKAVLERIRDCQANETVLDIGFGNGKLIKKLADLYEACFYGVEISQDMLNVARRRNKPFIEQGKIDLRYGSVADLPFEDNSFDRIYTVNTIYFWKDVDTGISEIKRILKPGGVFYNIGYTKEWLERLPYTQYGFSKYSIDELQSYGVRNGLQLIQHNTLKKRVSFCMAFMKPEAER